MIQQTLSIWSWFLCLSQIQLEHFEILGSWLLKAHLENFEHYLASVWDECNCAVVWTFLGIVLLWDWNENWPFPVLWPLLNLPNFLAYWVQHFSHFKTINPGQLNTWIPHSICQGKGSIKEADVVQSFPYIALVYINRSNCKAWHSASWLHKGKPGSPSTAYTELGRQGQNQGSACHCVIISTSLTLPKEGPVLLYPSSFLIWQPLVSPGPAGSLRAPPECSGECAGGPAHSCCSSLKSFPQ